MKPKPSELPRTTLLIVLVGGIGLAVALLHWLRPGLPPPSEPVLGATQQRMHALYESLLAGAPTPLRVEEACTYFAKTLTLSCKLSPNAEAPVRQALLRDGWVEGDPSSYGVPHWKESHVLYISCPQPPTGTSCELSIHRVLKPAT